MNTNNRLILSTSPLSQPAKKPRGTASFALRQRLLYGRKRRNPTGKERDSETGLYYFGARYLDGRTGRWISGDPAVGEYVPEAPINDEARKRNGNLPGMGGVFNYVNLHVYHYAGNNPVKYVDPDGRDDDEVIQENPQINKIEITFFTLFITDSENRNNWDYTNPENDVSIEFDTSPIRNPGIYEGSASPIDLAQIYLQHPEFNILTSDLNFPELSDADLIVIDTLPIKIATQSAYFKQTRQTGMTIKTTVIKYRRIE